MLEVRPGLLLGSGGDAEAVVLGMRSVTKHYPRVTHILSVNNDPPHWYPSVRGGEGVMGGGEGVGGGGEGVGGGGEGVGGGEEDVKGDATREDEQQDVGVAKKTSKQPAFATHFVRGSDQTSTDLLHHFEPCCHFIRVGLEGGGATLIHCEYGVSRSVTLVLAYLMWREGRPLRTLYQELKSRKTEIRPNAGFVEQLRLWGAMRCRIDPSNKEYKSYRLQCMAAEIKKTGSVESMALSVDPSLRAVDSTAYFRCRKCRRLLFTEESVLQHEIGRGQSAFKWHKRSRPPVGGTTQPPMHRSKVTEVTDLKLDSAAQSSDPNPNQLEPDWDGVGKLALDPLPPPSDNVTTNQEVETPPTLGTGHTHPPQGYETTELTRVREEVASVVVMGNQMVVGGASCSSYFIEPVEWMDAVVGCLEGKILCPKCSCRVGSFSWPGEQCSCGTWVVPAFQLHCARIDEVRTLTRRKTTPTTQQPAGTA